MIESVSIRVHPWLDLSPRGFAGRKTAENAVKTAPNGLKTSKIGPKRQNPGPQPRNSRNTRKSGNGKWPKPVKRPKTNDFDRKLTQIHANGAKAGSNYELFERGKPDFLAQRHRDAEKAGIFFWRLGVFV